jgi:starch phosphorylase
MKPLMEYTVVPNLPENLQPLKHLACNVCFSWQSEIRQLFRRIDPILWESSGHNPVLLLGQVSQQRLDELSRDQAFLGQLERVHEGFRRYLTQPRLRAMDYSPEKPFLVAYFSAEFGLTECIPNYSGGLGVLAGDHLKSASDLNVPLVGVGLLYQQGYFSQYLSADGWQMETYSVNDFHNMPLTLMRDDSGNPLQVTVTLKDQHVRCLIWRIDVGRIPLYLLDTNANDNPPDCRLITAHLYVGDREMRLQQEIVLGIGGVRALKALGIEPTVIHMNEGHSAFAALERINILRRETDLSFDAAREIVLASTVFTTHTPVPAGNEVFDPNLVRAYFEDYLKDLGLNFRVLVGYGRVDPWNDAEPFGMTPLALRLSAHTNGVSRLHGRVSQAMWQKVWPDNPVEDVPIDYVTNGIHVPTWISGEMAALFDRYLGPDWAEDPDNERVWERVNQIPVTELWRTQERCREQLVGFTRRRLMDKMSRVGASPDEIQQAGEVLDPDILTIGFARRFATYKRATLLFRDPDRLERILNHPEMPVQVVLAGKAHPQDTEGKAYIQQIVHLSRQERFRRRIVFLEDYNIFVANYLASGSDLWLNTPRRPLEACGTSGMKALANGGLNLSTLDGWWEEGFHPDFGWALGHGEVYRDHEAQDRIESRDLYNLLEKEVVPLFYQRGIDGIPRGWVEKMKAGLHELVPIFNAHRMVLEYYKRYYLPCSTRFNELCEDRFAQAKGLSEWRQKLMTGWHEIAVVEVRTSEGAERPVGQEVEVTARLRLGSLAPEDVTVEAYYGRLDYMGEFVARETAPLVCSDQQDGIYTFRGKIPCRETGRFGYTVRILPSLERLENRFVMGLVTWA